MIAGHRLSLPMVPRMKANPMTIPNRYNCTLIQGGCEPVQGTVYALTVKEARAKYHERMKAGLPFWTWSLSDIRVQRMGKMVIP